MEDFFGSLAVLVSAVFVLYFFGLIWWKIFSKAGYSGPLALLMFVPLVNLVLLCVLAFGEWPVHRKLNHIRKMLPPERTSIFDT